MLASTQTKIQNSPKEFKIGENVLKEFEEGKCSEMSTFEEQNNVAELQLVIISGKVVSLFPIEKVTMKSCGKVLERDLETLCKQTKQQYFDVWHRRTTLTY